MKQEKQRETNKEALNRTLAFLTEAQINLKNDPWSFSPGDLMAKHHVDRGRFLDARRANYFNFNKELKCWECLRAEPFELRHSRFLLRKRAENTKMRKSKKSIPQQTQISFDKIAVAAFPELADYKPNGLAKYSDKEIALEFKHRGLEFTPEGRIIKKVL